MRFAASFVLMCMWQTVCTLDSMFFTALTSHKSGSLSLNDRNRVRAIPLSATKLHRSRRLFNESNQDVAEEDIQQNLQRVLKDWKIVGKVSSVTATCTESPQTTQTMPLSRPTCSGSSRPKPPFETRGCSLKP